jgi:hypothetical protein
VIGNISLLILSFMFICTITIYLRNKWPDLDVIDFYIVFVLLHFGFIPFIRGLYFGKDIIFDFRYSNPLAIALVFGHILLILLIIRGLSRFFPPELSNCLKIRYLIEKYGCANKYILLTVYVCLVLFPIISYVIYGVKPYIMPEDFNKFGKSLPYWFTSIRTIYNYIAFCVLLGLLGNIFKSKKYQHLLWSILTLILALAVIISGRRYLVNIIVVWVILWLVYKKERIFRLRYVTVAILLVGVLFISSNMYQTYRGQILFKGGQVDVKKIENPLYAALNYHSTIQNFQLRAGTWELNFLVFNEQINKSGMTTNGILTWEALKSSIPRILWSGKHFSLIDDYLAEFYHVNRGAVNIAKNIFGLAQLDFGYLSIIIIPVILLMIIGIMGVIISKTSQYPTFIMIFTGNILWYLINIEGNGNEIFFMLRNIIIILWLFGLYILTDKIYRIYRNHKKEN